MTTTSHPKRSTAPTPLEKVVDFLQKGGVAKVGKLVQGQGIELVSTVDETQLNDYLVVVPRVGVCSAYWHTASFDQVGEHGAVLVNKAEVSLVK